MAQLSKKEVDALICVIEHTRRNISWREGGSFIDGNMEIDTKEIAKAELGIETIKRLIMTKQTI